MAHGGARAPPEPAHATSSRPSVGGPRRLASGPAPAVSALTSAIASAAYWGGNSPRRTSTSVNRRHRNVVGCWETPDSGCVTCFRRKAELGKDGRGAQGLPAGRRSSGLGVRHREELPDAVGLSRAPRAVGHEAELEHAVESTIDVAPGNPRGCRHVPRPVKVPPLGEGRPLRTAPRRAPFHGLCSPSVPTSPGS